MLGENLELALEHPHNHVHIPYSSSHHITPSAHPHMHVALSLPPSPPPHISFTPDECEEVEREAQTLVSIIEDIMGESIQQYF